MNKTFPLIEHALIPLALALLNIGAVHLIFLLAHQGWSTTAYTIPVCLSLVVLTGSIIAKNKWLLLVSIVFYPAVFLLEII